ncbi:hypothetical protein VOLCADRAFT_108265 [Volvox carteri f. nagariensis]|uniref:RING-type domain-containing protein n=1 Tax=Volvox carteri f. nagariensis TaxID=3068 RepID=D8UJ60_VOLCA|nr:uncharacterized protein VOLCADRAFT_108265 [Volvox carteri f. nagariensis]EFJ40230.1 hypothetical protein VOLCADRAFT_108265 [Volvox carteri f. nagariensis]|eukprot:XP_002958710.1 hypothetical protein VOLCADRAFT_108265 [Volvox carteri f. nagariensis]
MDRAAKLQEIRERQNRWLRERQAELDRRHVVSELQQQQQHHSSSPQPQQRRGGVAAAPAPATAAGGLSPAGVTLPPLAAAPVSSVSGNGPLSAAPSGVLPSALGGVGGVKPEEVIDRLTERITDRLRNELKVELQARAFQLCLWRDPKSEPNHNPGRESESLAAQQGALDTFLVKELESQNTCPVCYELMVPPQHAPVMLFPCGHSFCGRCLEQHIDRNKKTQCPICRKKIESRAPNYSLQQLIQQVVAKKESASRGGPAALGGPLSPGAAAGGGMSPGGPRGEGDGEPCSNVDRLAAVQAELDLVREQLGHQGAKVTDLARQAEAVRQRKELLEATLGPLEQEVEKLEVLMAGVMELRG